MTPDRGHDTGAELDVLGAPQHWLVRRSTIRRLWILFVVILAATVAPDPFIHQHESFGIEDSFGFFAWYGFLTCVAMVVGAKTLSIFLKRKDSYYDR